MREVKSVLNSSKYYELIFSVKYYKLNNATTMLLLVQTYYRREITSLRRPQLAVELSKVYSKRGSGPNVMIV